jgi:Cu/Ag efflux protein CusF
MKTLKVFLALAILGLPAAHAAEPQADTTAAATTPLSEGEIRKVDKSTGKVTIKHGPLANLDMPGMTMVFRVQDPAWLEKMKSGDKIRFRAESINGALTVIQYEPVK